MTIPTTAEPSAEAMKLAERIIETVRDAGDAVRDAWGNAEQVAGLVLQVGPDIARLIDAHHADLLRQLEELQGVVDRLPLTRDGKRYAPHMVLWYVHPGLGKVREIRVGLDPSYAWTGPLPASRSAAVHHPHPRRRDPHSKRRGER